MKQEYRLSPIGQAIGNRGNHWAIDMQEGREDIAICELAEFWPRFSQVEASQGEEIHVTQVEALSLKN